VSAVGRSLLVLFALGCHAHSPAAPVQGRAAGDDVTLYRDWAIIRQRVELDVRSTLSKSVEVAAGVTADHVVVLDRGGLTITSLHIPTKDEFADPNVPTKLTFDVSAPRPGHYTIVVSYLTDRLDWDVAYTMKANPARDRARVRGALAIYNRSGISLRAASARLIDAELGAWRGKTSEQLATTLIGGTPSSTPPVTPRELGPLVLGSGQTRVELLGEVTRAMNSVLVYDPIGTRLDHTGSAPLVDDSLGVVEKASTRVSENFEVERDKTASAGLPAGPVRLLEAKPDGSLSVLGEARLFDAATRVAAVDTIAVGMAEGVTGKRERRELTVSDDGARITEEFVLTIDNARAYPASVLLREHLYRGQNWTLAFHSVADAVKEGPQQIAMRTRVPAKSQLKVMYVVVYTSGQ
jgi:hypothetical protein